MTTRPAGDSGLLVELDPKIAFDELHAAADAASGLAGVAACIVGHSSLYLLFEEPGPRSERVSAALSNPSRRRIHSVHRHRIPVDVGRESAPDLDHLLSAAKISSDSFRQILATLRLRARYLGFRAGFAYLEGLPPDWNLPRLARPRTTVPAGSFGIAAGMAAFYPSESPGGWNLIGRSAEVFWDPHRDPPNLIAPGDEVTIEPVDKLPAVSAPKVDETFEGDPIAEILRPGQLTLIVGAADLRRYRHGLPIGGPFDPEAALAANAAVGNSPRGALLECVLVGPQLVFLDSAELSWQGARAEVLVDEGEIRDPNYFSVSAGAVVTIGRLRGGMRGYLAVRGGVASPAAKYAVAPTALRAGGKIRRGSEAGRAGEVARPSRSDPHLIGALAGPHQVDDQQLQALQDQLWEVTPALDRTGIRLRPLERVIEQPGNLPSCGMQFGTVQWHPSGELVALGPDHPITGGYLQPITVASAERWKLGQLAPGDRVRWLIDQNG